MVNETGLERRGLTRLLVRWLVHRYYPQLEITGAERIPRSGPVLLCANHGNSLVDPVLIGIAAVRPVRFMAKAPLFDTPVLGDAMSALGMIPAYRSSDDARSVRNNFESLDVAADVLISGSAMGIFPEGKSTDHAHLEGVKSGPARMALQAVESGAEDLVVVPIGLSYQQKEQSRSAAWVNIGRPLRVSDLLAEYDGDVRKARRALTTELEVRLKEVVTHLDEPEWEPSLTLLETLVEPDDEMRGFPLHQRKRIADAINFFHREAPERTARIAEQLETYRQRVAECGLTPQSPILTQHGLWLGLTLTGRALRLLCSATPAAIGTIANLVPFLMVRRLAARFDQPGRKTIASNRLLAGAPIYTVWWLLLSAAALTIVPWWGVPLCWLLLPWTGLIALDFWRTGRDSAQLLSQQLRCLAQPAQMTELRSQRNRLCETLKSLASDFAARTSQSG